jgi:DNA polymerase III subunit delta'
MTFQSILGQDAAVGTLRRALANGKLHHAYRFEGPDGVGKEMAAFALAQALLCERSAGRAEGCGECSACRRAVTLAKDDPQVPVHPDVILVERGLYPAATIGKDSEEVKDISVHQLRKVVMAKMAFTPHEGRSRLVIIRRAEEMGVSAANTLLKTIEEPPAGTHFVLLTSRGQQLLDTIRSRTQVVRFAPLSDGVLGTILAAKKVPEGVIPLAIEMSGGSASQALEVADPEASQERLAFVESVMRALWAADSAPSLAVAAGRHKDRDVMRDRLAALSTAMAREARQSLGDPARARKLSECFSIVLVAMRELDRNASPALLLEAMMLRMRAVPPAR